MKVNSFLNFDAASLRADPHPYGMESENLCSRSQYMAEEYCPQFRQLCKTKL